MYDEIAINILENGWFCLFRYEKQKGKQTKVPYQENIHRATSRHMQHFISFEEV